MAIELWATPTGLQSWSRIFDLGSSDTENLYMSWTEGTNQYSDKVGWKHGSTYNYLENTNQPYNLNTEYHIVMQLSPVGTSTQVTWYTAPSGGTSLGSARGSFTTTNNLASFIDNADNLGRSFYTADGVASASYNEVRFWSGTLDSNFLQLLHAAGPDADLNSSSIGGRLPSSTALILSGSTATLDLNGMTQTVGSLSGVVGSSVLLGGGSLTFGGDGTPTTFSGTISWTGQPDQNRHGHYHARRRGNFSGATYINAGTLQINSLSAVMHSIAGTGALAVGDGINPDNLTADSVAVGTLTLAAGSTLTISPIAGGPLSEQLQPVPEPSNIVLLLLACSILLAKKWGGNVSQIH